jgi:hypothetical protein
MGNFRIITITQEERDELGADCLICAFDYMVEHIETGGRWFGSNDYNECQTYINNL